MTAMQYICLAGAVVHLVAAVSWGVLAFVVYKASKELK